MKAGRKRGNYDGIRKKIVAHYEKIGETIKPDQVKIESEMAEVACKSEWAWRRIVNQETTQSSAFNIATFNVDIDEISYDTPHESRTNADVRWSIVSTLQAGSKNYNGDGLSKAHSNKKKPHHAKRGPKSKSNMGRKRYG
jgi:hypothetical protein